MNRIPADGVNWSAPGAADVKSMRDFYVKDCGHSVRKMVRLMSKELRSG